MYGAGLSLLSCPRSQSSVIRFYFPWRFWVSFTELLISWLSKDVWIFGWRFLNLPEQFFSYLGGGRGVIIFRYKFLVLRILKFHLDLRGIMPSGGSSRWLSWISLAIVQMFSSNQFKCWWSHWLWTQFPLKGQIDFPQYTREGIFQQTLPMSA